MLSHGFEKSQPRLSANRKEASPLQGKAYFMKLRPGVFIGNGKYKLVARLGEGGQAEVWGAVQIGLGDFSKEVVLKCVHLDDKTGPEQRGMLLHEARLAARLQHPNIVEIYDVGEEQDLVYIAMERIQGYDLEVILARSKEITKKPIPWSLAVYVVIEVSKGLHYAHTHVGRDGRPLHLVHRDLKPSNILLSRNGFVKVIDFGIAKATNHPAKEGNTLNGQIKGTPSYMSPEQIYARPLDARSDLFALGSILYELCSGERPFSGDEVFSIMMAVTQNTPSSLFALTPNIPAQLEDAVFRLLEKDPEKRFQNARDLQRELDMILRERDLFIDQEDLARFYEETVGDFVPSKNEASLVGASQDFQSLAQSMGDYAHAQEAYPDYVPPVYPEANYHPASPSYLPPRPALQGVDVWDISELSENEETSGDETITGDETFLESGGKSSPRPDAVDVVAMESDASLLKSSSPAPTGKLDTRQLPAFQGPQDLSDLLGSSEALPSASILKSKISGLDALGGDSGMVGVDFAIPQEALSLLDAYHKPNDLLDVMAPTETFIPAVSGDTGDHTNLTVGPSPHAAPLPLPRKVSRLSEGGDQTTGDATLGEPADVPKRPDHAVGASNLPRPPMVSADGKREGRPPSAHEIPTVSSAGAGASMRPLSVPEIPQVGSSKRPLSAHEIPQVRAGGRGPSLQEVPQIAGTPLSMEVPRALPKTEEAVRPRSFPEVARVEKPAGAGQNEIQHGSVSFAEVRLKATPVEGETARSGGGLASVPSPLPTNRSHDPLRQPVRAVATGQIPHVDFAVHPPEYAPSELAKGVDAAGRFAPRIPERLDTSARPITPLHASPQILATPKQDDAKTMSLLLRLILLVGLVGVLAVSYAAFQFVRSRTLEDGRALVRFDFSPACQLHLLKKADPEMVSKTLGLSNTAQIRLEPDLYYFLCESEENRLSFFNSSPYKIRDDRREQLIQERFPQIRVTLLSQGQPAIIYHPRFKKPIGKTDKPFVLTIPHQEIRLRVVLESDPRVEKKVAIPASQDNDMEQPLWKAGEVKELLEKHKPKALPPHEEPSPEPPKRRVKRRRR